MNYGTEPSFVNALVNTGRTLVVGIYGPPGSGKTCLAQLLHGFTKYNRRYYYEPHAEIISSVRNIDGASYLLETVEHSTAPCHVRVFVGGFSDVEEENDGYISMLSRMDVDTFEPKFDYYSSFVDGYVASLHDYKKIESLKNDLNIDWREVYRHHKMRHVEHDHIRNFLHQKFGVTRFLQDLLTIREKLLPNAQNNFFRYKNALSWRYFKIVINDGIIMFKNEEVCITQKHPTLLTLQEINIEDIARVNSVEKMAYMLAFEKDCNVFSYLSHVVPLKFEKYNNSYLVHSKSVEDAEYVLSSLPSAIKFETLTKVYLTVNGRTPVFEFSHHLKAPINTDVTLRMTAEYCNNLSEFDEMFIVVGESGFHFGNFVMEAQGMSVKQQFPVANSMLETLFTHFKTPHCFYATLVRLVDFSCGHKLIDPNILEQELCGLSFQERLKYEFSEFLRPYLHIIESVENYKIIIESYPQTGWIAKLCAERRAHIKFDRSYMNLSLPVSEEPGIEDELLHCLKQYEIIEQSTSWEFLECLHSDDFNDVDYPACIEIRPTYRELGDYLLERAFLENELFGSQIQE